MVAELWGDWNRLGVTAAQRGCLVTAVWGGVCLPGGEPELHHQGEHGGTSEGRPGRGPPAHSSGDGSGGLPRSEDAPWQRPEDAGQCRPPVGEFGI